MNKREFVELVKENGEYSSFKDAENAIKAFTNSIIDVCKKNETLTLVGFGTYSVMEMAEKSGTVPGTDKKYHKPAYKAPKFKFGKQVKDQIR
ncbi:HU family DNA-binding protein [Aquamicrobium sp.]|uniref:HU family DNA-binding protein n=1 Tax=Aquamicrobium sp. TaxID=1872579 RepID=UPI002584FAC0|nr:HU family DNA-binding protein [Aquamicrobium sp.]MCK9549287.1 HU family DNA-binding protein [Aquamicrobium sp.]